MYKSGLVLEGGGLRAVYTSGVLDAFMDKGIEFPYIIGVSAGTCNGVSYIAHDRGRMKEITLGYSGDERYMSLKSAFKNGEYLNTDWIFGELSYEMFPLSYDNYDNSKTVMCVGVTNVATGKPEYFYPKDFREGCDELKASCALPFFTKPVQIGMDFYCDGGLSDSIPAERAFDDGCAKCVIILTQDRHFVKPPVGREKVVRSLLRKYPTVADVLLNRHNVYNMQREYCFEQEKLGNAMIICPDKPLNCPTLERNSDKLHDIYYTGFGDGLKYADRVKEFIK
jgi:predicted patatin/cPLA2 family phospholipase